MSRTDISSHYANDDRRLYEFTRNTRLPHGTFDQHPRITPNALLWAATAILAVALLTASCA